MGGSEVCSSGIVRLGFYNRFVPFPPVTSLRGALFHRCWLALMLGVSYSRSRRRHPRRRHRSYWRRVFKLREEHGSSSHCTSCSTPSLQNCAADRPHAQ